MKTETITKPEMSEELRQWFRQQGARGGRKSADSKTSAQRSRASRKAARARWAKVRAQQEGQ